MCIWAYWGDKTWNSQGNPAQMQRSNFKWCMFSQQSIQTDWLPQDRISNIKSCWATHCLGSLANLATLVVNEFSISLSLCNLLLNRRYKRRVERNRLVECIKTNEPHESPSILSERVNWLAKFQLGSSNGYSQQDALATLKLRKIKGSSICSSVIICSQSFGEVG